MYQRDYQAYYGWCQEVADVVDLLATQHKHKLNSDQTRFVMDLYHNGAPTGYLTFKQMSWLGKIAYWHMQDCKYNDKNWWDGTIQRIKMEQNTPPNIPREFLETVPSAQTFNDRFMSRLEDKQEYVEPINEDPFDDIPF